MIKTSATPFYVESADLSLAWGQVLLQLMSPGVSEISPLTLSIHGFSDAGVVQETSSIRFKLEQLLINKQVTIDIENVAFTIFPEEYWQLSNGDRREFFSLYRKAFIRIQDWNAKHNARGSYFQRLVDYEGEDKGYNQLAWILDEFDRSPSQRVSQFQATTFDPRRDQTRSAQLEFPCLQQISFIPMRDGMLSMTAYYATQQIFRKGYGNYLGLCRLGAFMAGQMGLKLGRVTIFVGVAKMDVGKTDPSLVEFAEHLRSIISGSNPSKKVA